MAEATAPTYLPIAKAAHIQGNIILMASFAQNGSVESLRVISGPAMLQSGAVDFVKGWKANSYAGPRTCPIAVSYALVDAAIDGQVQQGRTDPQHYTVVGQSICLCDPSGVIGRRRRWLGIF